MKRVLVVGDSMLDKYIYGVVERLNPEYPGVILQYEDERWYPGGAGNVAANIFYLSDKSKISVDLICPVSPQFVSCVPSGIGICGVSTKDLLVKNRYVSGHSQLLRMDEGCRYSFNIVENMDSVLLNTDLSVYDLIVVSDYAKGALDGDLLYIVTTQDVPVIIDYKKREASHPEDLGNTIIKCNEKEWADNNFFDDVKKISLVVTRSNKGYEVDGQTFPATSKTLAPNVIGAGDSFLAGMAVNYLETGHFNAVEMAAFGSKVAAKKVELTGTEAVKREMLNG